MKRKSAVAALLLLAVSAAFNAQPQTAAARPDPVVLTEAWAFCGVRPNDPFAQQIANQLATVAGIDATFGPCIVPPMDTYTADEPGIRYVDPATYMQVVQINANAGMKTVVYDKRVWSDNKADRDAAVAFWTPVSEHIAAWDLGDEFNYGSYQWPILIHRWNLVRADVMVRTGVPPYTNHFREYIDEALRDLPGANKLLSFTFYTGDLGASLARQFNAQVENLMCGINAYKHSTTQPFVDFDFKPTVASIRDGMHSLSAAGCDSFLVFGGAMVYDNDASDPFQFAPVGLVDLQGTATDWSTGTLEGAGSSSYTPVGPARLMDTRAGQSTIDGKDNGIGGRAAESTTVLQVTGRAGVTPKATSAALNITVTNAALDGFVTVFPCDAQRPNAAQVTYSPQVDVATQVITQLSASGQACLYTHAPIDLVVDVSGFTPIGSTYTPVRPARLLETRTDAGLGTVDGQYLGVGFRGAGSVTELQVSGRGGVVSGATDVVLSITATNVGRDGFVTVYPCTPDRPTASNLNYHVGAAATNTVVAPLRSDGRLCLFTLSDIDLVVDVSGFYIRTSPLVSLQPTRVLDTRISGVPLPIDGLELLPGVRDPNPPIVVQVAGRGGVPDTARSAVLNVTVTGPVKVGFITVYPCGETRPTASNVNFTAGATVANLVVAEIGQRGAVCIFKSADTQVVVDVSGYHP